MNALFIAVKTLAGIVYPGAESRKWDPEFWPRPTWSAHTVLQPFTKGICFIWQIRARLSIFDIEASQYEPQHWPFACLASWQLWSGAKLLKKNAFFFFCPDKCNSCTDESSDATETSQTPIPGDATSDGQHHMTENHTHDGLVRSKC